MKFSGKMCFKIILKVNKKKQGSTLSTEITFLKKPRRLGLPQESNLVSLINFNKLEKPFVCAVEVTHRFLLL